MYAKFIQEDGRWAFAFEQADETWLDYPDEQHAALFQAINDALPAPKVIGIGPDGLPEVQDPPPLTGNAALMQKIIALEAQQSPRRLREATLGIDNGWLKNLNDQINTLRVQLV